MELMYVEAKANLGFENKLMLILYVYQGTWTRKPQENSEP